MNHDSRWNSRHDAEGDDATEGDPSGLLAVATVAVVLGVLAVGLFVTVGVLAWKAGTP